MSSDGDFIAAAGCLVALYVAMVVGVIAFIAWVLVNFVIPAIKA